MPSTFSQIQYTDLRLHYLHHDDPWSSISSYKAIKALWVKFKTTTKDNTSTVYCRILIHKNDTFMHIVCRRIPTHWYSTSRRDSSWYWNHVSKRSAQYYSSIMTHYDFKLNGYNKALFKDLNIYDAVNHSSILFVTSLHSVKPAP
eukprot:329277_1